MSIDGERLPCERWASSNVFIDVAHLTPSILVEENKVPVVGDRARIGSAEVEPPERGVMQTPAAFSQFSLARNLRWRSDGNAYVAAFKVVSRYSLHV